MLDRSIAYRLSIYISIAVIGVFIAFMLITYFFNSKSINKNIENYAFGESQKVIMEVEKQLVATREISTNVADQVIFYGQHDHPGLLITGILNKYPFINAIHVNIDSVIPELQYHNYLGYRDQDSIMLELRNEKVYQCKNLKRAIEEIAKDQVPRWTDITMCPRTNKSLMSYYQPIYYDNNLRQKVVGEVICELSLEMLNEIINNLNIDHDGFAFFTSRDGTYLTHPIKDWINSKSIYTVPDDVYNKTKINIREILDKGLSNTLVVYPEHRNYKKHWGYITRIEEAEWTLFFAMPYKELYEPLYLSILKMLFFSVLGILVIYLIITYITNRLIEPLSTVTSQLQRFTGLRGKEKSESLNEILLVSDSLDYIQSWYEKIKLDKTHEDAKSKIREQDLHQASEIQHSLIKTDFTDLDKIEEIDISAVYKPAKIVSGDLFDYYFAL